jgi:hypothetical protein
MNMVNAMIKVIICLNISPFQTATRNDADCYKGKQALIWHIHHCTKRDAGNTNISKVYNTPCIFRHTLNGSALQGL